MCFAVFESYLHILAPSVHSLHQAVYTQLPAALQGAKMHKSLCTEGHRRSNPILRIKHWAAC